MTHSTPSDARAAFARTFDAVSLTICDDGARDADSLWSRVCEDAGLDAHASDAWSVADVRAAYLALAEVAEAVGEATLAGEARRFAADLEDASEAYADEPYAASGAPAAAPFPAFARQDAVEEDGALVLAHLLAVGVGFNARAKVNASETYTLRHAGSTLAIPSKLSHTSVFPTATEALEDATAGAAFYPTRLYRCEAVDGTPQVVVLAETVPGDAASITAVGFLQDKHARWISPLLAGTVPMGRASDTDCPVRVYVTAVTGGVAGKPTRGVNVAICGVPDAIRAAYDAEALEAEREAAYGSGSRAAVEAAL